MSPTCKVLLHVPRGITKSVSDPPQGVAIPVGGDTLCIIKLEYKAVYVWPMHTKEGQGGKQGKSKLGSRQRE